MIKEPIVREADPSSNDVGVRLVKREADTLHLDMDP